MGRSRNFGLNHGAGKGDKDRTSDRKAFEQNFSEIDWSVIDPFLGDPKVSRKGGRLIKRYS